MTGYQRKYYNQIISRLSEPRKFIQVLAGPRQVGKTTLVRQVEAGISTTFLFFSADAVETNDEVGYILVSQGEALALEVKSGKRGMNSGLPLFAKKYHPKQSIVIGTDGIPLEEFFTADLTALL